ncbi:MAG TPA: response regulator transcription factor [Solirubrobacteraceae bacterium]|jgi:DNA-binding NarL/FixJ family response regulator|nr:response regulator transcription factor [Solirubrobacteraceae bacterium]
MTDTTTHDRPRLLIADDDPVVQSMLGMRLGEQFEVVGVAVDGEQAVTLARESQPDVALVDVEMPSGGGLRAVQGITEVAPATAIVILSGDESDSVVRQLIQAGATAYRRKGARAEEIAASLTESIEAHGRARGGGS